MNFIKFPLFMRRKRKILFLDAILEANKKSMRKKKCDDCKRMFTEEASKWGKNDFTSCICILCHKDYFHLKISDYYLKEERDEIRRLKKQKEKKK